MLGSRAEDRSQMILPAVGLLAVLAIAIFIGLATTNAAYQQKLISWYDPSNVDTRRWGWWRMYGSYGRAARSYALRTGPLAVASGEC